MGKKDKNKKGKQAKKNTGTVIWIIGAIAIFAVIVLVTGNFPFGGVDEQKGRSFSVQGGETRPTLSPSLFTGKTMAAYAIAKKYPEILDQVYCYCYCDDPPFHHKSLLSCFVDRHAAA
ncbi:MAG: hypothetical protein JSV13_06055 [Nitrospiraceae bacterium]|nr:MAG: hypothetical protein JSV13_06055 [Nitrospiraceae bacterium]